MRLRAPRTYGMVFGALALIAVSPILVGAPRTASAFEAPVGLGTATSFAVLAGAGVTNTGTTTVNGDLGTCPTPAITGSPQVNGSTHANDAVACKAQEDLTIAYNDAAGRAPNTTYTGPTDLGGLTLVPGVYKSPSSFAITGTLTLDAKDDPNAVWVFQTASTLITAVNSAVSLVNGAQACNVFWQIGSSATLNVRTDFVGTIMALKSTSVKNQGTVDGRVLVRRGAVTLDNNVITRSDCAPTTTTTEGARTTTTEAPTNTTTEAPTTTTTGRGTTTTTVAPTTTTVPGVEQTTTTTTEKPDGATTTGTGPSTTATTDTTGRTASVPGQDDQAPGSVAGDTTVRKQPGSLPRTGTSVVHLLLLAASVVALGAVLRR